MLFLVFWVFSAMTARESARAILERNVVSSDIRFNPLSSGGKDTSPHLKNLKSFRTFESLRGFENLEEIFLINVIARRDPYKIAQMIGCMEDICVSLTCR
jgi:hypothetical protein